jgi:hypothetical protein
MTNAERRLALARARRNALEYADVAEQAGGTTIALANMWANVAQALKVGENLEADGAIPEPISDFIER